MRSSDISAIWVELGHFVLPTTTLRFPQTCRAQLVLHYGGSFNARSRHQIVAVHLALLPENFCVNLILIKEWREEVVVIFFRRALFDQHSSLIDGPTHAHLVLDNLVGGIGEQLPFCVLHLLWAKTITVSACLRKEIGHRSPQDFLQNGQFISLFRR